MVTPNVFPRTTVQRTCEACLLADKMKDCNTCKFYIQYYRATPEDVYRMWVKLWGDLALPTSAQQYKQGESR